MWATIILSLLLLKWNHFKQPKCSITIERHLTPFLKHKKNHGSTQLAILRGYQLYKPTRINESIKFYSHLFGSWTLEFPWLCMCKGHFNTWKDINLKLEPKLRGHGYFSFIWALSKWLLINMRYHNTPNLPRKI